jgi:hypothetical protein
MSTDRQNRSTDAHLRTDGTVICNPDHEFETSLRIVDAKLAKIRQCASEGVERFIDRLTATCTLPNELLLRLPVICDRFLTSVGLIFRDEIPSDEIPREERLKATSFTIDWSTAEVKGCWIELGVAFQVRDSLEYCAEHMAGASGDLIQLLSKQYLEDLAQGRITPPRFTEVERTDSSVTLRWQLARLF